jgi:hypothetical protein
LPTTNQFFSLQEISKHLLNEVILADADFQIAQREAWRNVSASFKLMDGFSQMESLQVNEFNFDLPIQPYKPSLWKNLIWMINKKRPPGTLYRVSKRDDKRKDIHVKIKLQRGKLNGYETQIESNPPIEEKPEDTYVAGAFK